MPEKTKEALKQESLSLAPEGQPQFPYGMKLCFERDQFELLPQLKDFTIGQKLSVTAEATVTMQRSAQMQSDKPEQVIEIQIESIDVQPLEKKPVEKMTPEEYRKMREGM